MPTNALLWILAVGARELEVSLNGTKLTASTEPFSYELGELAPNSTYTVAFDFRDYFLPVHLEQTFSTGSGPADPEPAAAPSAVVASRRAGRDWPLSDFCTAVRLAQGCFDTGQDTHFLFEPEKGAATAWLIRNDRPYSVGPFLWPTECGAADFYSQSFTRPCLTLSGIDRVGILHEGSSTCAPAAGVVEPEMDPSPEPAPPLDVTASPSAASSEVASPHVGGCSLRMPHTCCARPWLGALVALGLAAGRRRRARTAHAR